MVCPRSWRRTTRQSCSCASAPWRGFGRTNGPTHHRTSDACNSPPSPLARLGVHPQREGLHDALTVSPPREVVEEDLLALGGVADLPPLEAVTDVPVLRPDGSVLDLPGYDARTRLVYAPVLSLALPSVPAAPTAEDVQARTGNILDFSWTSPSYFWRRAQALWRFAYSHHAAR